MRSGARRIRRDPDAVPRCGAPCASGAPCDAIGRPAFRGRCYLHRREPPRENVPVAAPVPFPPRPRCASLNATGSRCHNTTVPGSDYCTVHRDRPRGEPPERIECATVDALGYPCKRVVRRHGDKCIWHRVDRPRCSALSTLGKPCHSLAKKGMAYCSQHLRRAAVVRDLESECGQLRERVRELEQRLAEALADHHHAAVLDGAP